MKTWPFDIAPMTPVITTRQVLDDGLPILVVLHFLSDGSWGFLCGTADLEEDGEEVPLLELVNLDRTLLKIADLPRGWKAWRPARGKPWNSAINDADTLVETIGDTE
ncbi:MAG: hypothetical protein SFY80_11930 [Verrucomicrobiota bacterium]|nr:hypothetical protein [Verrucomicrobiota bacterium]